ncbi:MAG: ABC transporter permease [Thermoanaerobaculia bacterium]
MTGYLARRVLHGGLVLVALSFATFVLAEIAPGDFLAEMRLDPQIPAETVEALKTRYGLDQPLPLRYLRWLRSVAAGELGHSFARGVPVADLIWPRVRNTLLLTVTAMILAWLLALPLGMVAASRRGGWTDRLLRGVAAVPLAVPDLVLGLGCLLLAARSGLFPIGGMTSLDAADLGFWRRTTDLAWHLTLPATALAVASLPVLLHHVRAALADVLDAPFLRAARGHGIRRRRLLFHYALPAAAHPLISLFGLSLGRLLSGSLLIEVILDWPGLGPLLLDAILARDLHVVVAVTLLSAAVLIAGNLVADVLLFAVDPRIRAPEAA